MGKNTPEEKLEKLTCRCGYEWGINIAQIPVGDKYEVVCPKCGMALMKKRIERG